MTIAVRGGPHGTLYLRLQVGAGLVGKMGWKDGDAVEIAWGRGPDLGKLRLRAPARATGYRIKESSRGGWAISLGAPPADQIKPEKMEPKKATVQHTVDGVDPTLYVVIPVSFRPKLSASEAAA